MALENFPQTRKLTVEIEVWADDDGYPTAVEVTGEPVEALRLATLKDLAQEGINSQMGSVGHFLRPDYQSGRDENRARFIVSDKTEQVRERLEARH